jgi:tight adherence protein C
MIGAASFIAAALVVACAPGAWRRIIIGPARPVESFTPSSTTGAVRLRHAVRARAVRRIGRWMAVAAAIAVAVVALGPPLVFVVAAGLGLASRLRPLWADRRRQVLIDRAVPDAIELFVLAVHAGLTPVQAVRELTTVAAPIVRNGFEAVVHRLDRGEPFGSALRALPDELGVGMVGLADVVASADRYGLPLAPVLESLALEARASRRRSDEADARRLPVKLAFPLVVCTLPSFVLLAIAPALVAALSSLSIPI